MLRAKRRFQARFTALTALSRLFDRYHQHSRLWTVKLLILQLKAYGHDLQYTKEVRQATRIQAAWRGYLSRKARTKAQKQVRDTMGRRVREKVRGWVRGWRVRKVL